MRLPRAYSDDSRLPPDILIEKLRDANRRGGNKQEIPTLTEICVLVRVGTYTECYCYYFGHSSLGVFVFAGPVALAEIIGVLPDSSLAVPEPFGTVSASPIIVYEAVFVCVETVSQRVFLMVLAM